MAKTMDPILPILSVLGYWAIILGSFGGPGRGVGGEGCWGLDTTNEAPRRCK